MTFCFTSIFFGVDFGYLWGKLIVALLNDLSFIFYMADRHIVPYGNIIVDIDKLRKHC